MAKKKAATVYEPDAEYRVQLTAPVKIGGMKFLPRDEHHMRGSALNELSLENADVIGSAIRV